MHLVEGPTRQVSLKLCRRNKRNQPYEYRYPAKGQCGVDDQLSPECLVVGKPGLKFQRRLKLTRLRLKPTRRFYADVPQQVIG